MACCSTKMDSGQRRGFFSLHVTKNWWSKAMVLSTCCQQYIDDYTNCFVLKASPADSPASALIVASIPCYLGAFSTKKKRETIVTTPGLHQRLYSHVCTVGALCLDSRRVARVNMNIIRYWNIGMINWVEREAQELSGRSPYYIVWWGFVVPLKITWSGQ
jgi:hypothetical protein